MFSRGIAIMAEEGRQLTSLRRIELDTKCCVAESVNVGKQTVEGSSAPAARC